MLICMPQTRCTRWTYRGLLWLNKVTRPFSDLIDLSGYFWEVMLLLLDIDSRSPDEQGPCLLWWELGLCQQYH